MKPRALKARLKCNHIVHVSKGKLCIGSPLVSKIISIDPIALSMEFTFGGERTTDPKISNTELRRIWNELKVLIKSGQFVEYISGFDEISNPLPVFCFRHDALIKEFTDQYGWPNITVEGVLMHDNEYFTTAAAAIDNYRANTQARIEMERERVGSLEEEISERKSLLAKLESCLANLAASSTDCIA